jgi:cellobiose phosphorylase
MLDAVNKYLRTDAGLKLCTLVDYDRLGVKTGTALYFPGDRENCGVFKHAAMMATVASLKAAKETEDEALAKDLAELAFFMLDRTLPYLTFEAPFTYKGNPRFCTQYNNSETGENIGPMLSGTASWLTLALYEIFGICETGDALAFRPLLRPGETQTGFAMKLGNARIRVRIKTDGKKFRADANTSVTLDGAPVGKDFPKPESGEHEVVISL